MNRRQLLIIWLLGLSVCFFSFSSFADELKRHGNVIEVQVDEVFVIALDSSRASGFKWELAKPLNKKKIEFISSKYKAITEDRRGNLGEDIFIFKAVGIGKMILYLKYVRPGEKGKPPAKKAAFVVIITKK